MPDGGDGGDARAVRATPSTPTQRYKKQHYPTLTKARVKAIVEFADKHRIDISKEQIFSDLGVSRSRGYRMLKTSDRRHNNDPHISERRGRPRFFRREDLQRAEEILEKCDHDGRFLTWAQLAYEIFADYEIMPSVPTIRSALGSIGYHMCVVCRKPWISQKHAERRLEWAKEALAKRPNPEDWHDVRFSDECHYNYGNDGRVFCIRRPGERLRNYCIQRNKSEDTRHLKRIHT